MASQQQQRNNKDSDESKKATFGLEVRLQTRALMTVRRKYVAPEENPRAMIESLQATDSARVAAVAREAHPMTSAVIPIVRDAVAEAARQLS